MNVAESAAFEAVFESGETGLIPGLEFAIIDNDGVTVFGPTTNNLAEQIVDGNPTGVYVIQVAAAPGTTGQYTMVWSRDGSFQPNSVSVDELVVLTEEDASGQLPPIPSDDDDGLMWGPCSSWTTVADLADFCESALPENSNPLELIPDMERAIASASQFLWAASGRQFSGLCQRTARPCRTGCVCDWQVLSRGYVVFASPFASDCAWMSDGTPCGCAAVSEVKLAGYPIREIVDVTIDGVSVDADTYELRENRYLVRLGDERWPSCQDMTATDDGEGSFAVTYTYGQAPPQLGKDAAMQLACEILKARFDSEDCVLPAGVRRVTRQGIVFDANYFVRNADGMWATGLTYVDMFLGAVNPAGLQRRPKIWAPGRRYAR